MNIESIWLRIFFFSYFFHIFIWKRCCINSSHFLTFGWVSSCELFHCVYFQLVKIRRYLEMCLEGKPWFQSEATEASCFTNFSPHLPPFWCDGGAHARVDRSWLLPRFGKLPERVFFLSVYIYSHRSVASPIPTGMGDWPVETYVRPFAHRG